jgi:hypothetical protein
MATLGEWDEVGMSRELPAAKRRERRKLSEQAALFQCNFV